VQGGSTIAQQLVRDRYLGHGRLSLRQKLREACLAVQLAQRWSKRRILKGYLNLVFYGHHAYGAQAAAWTYFSRPARRLTLAQAALLAGLPQAPSDYDPFRRPKATLARRNEVLAAMRRNDEIPNRFRRATGRPLGLRPGHRYERVRFATFLRPRPARAGPPKRLQAGAARRAARPDDARPTPATRRRPGGRRLASPPLGPSRCIGSDRPAHRSSPRDDGS
jgi:membrane peptidoglycan carboxypeptidase